MSVTSLVKSERAGSHRANTWADQAMSINRLRDTQFSKQTTILENAFGL